jgi:hypothetical protein
MCYSSVTRSPFSYLAATRHRGQSLPTVTSDQPTHIIYQQALRKGARRGHAVGQARRSPSSAQGMPATDRCGWGSRSNRTTWRAEVCWLASEGSVVLLCGLRAADYSGEVVAQDRAVG